MIKALSSGSLQFIIASNRTREKAEHLAKDLGIRVGNNRKVAGQSEVIFLCVRPLEIKAVLKELSDLLKPEKLLVSAAVDFSLKDLEACHRQALRGRRSAF
ncbi:MAG: NAD(P)-binding domain-containing protein [Methanothrix sp.]|nr:NAD(P)-binding domain-containing protein [Methanothrix sp.]